LPTLPCAPRSAPFVGPSVEQAARRYWATGGLAAVHALAASGRPVESLSPTERTPTADYFTSRTRDRRFASLQSRDRRPRGFFQAGPPRPFFSRALTQFQKPRLR
jgi:hypothetical protein